MNKWMSVLAFVLIVPFSCLGVLEAVRLSIGGLQDLALGAGRIEADQKQLVKELKEKVGLSDYKLPVRNSNALLKFLGGWRSAATLPFYNRLYINKEWLNELSPDEQAFVICSKLIDVKNNTALKKIILFLLVKAAQKQKKQTLLGFSLLQLFESLCFRLLEAETDKEAVRLLKTTQGAHDLLYKMAYPETDKGPWYRKIQVASHRLMYPLLTLPGIKWVFYSAPYEDRIKNIEEIVV